ncbi:hypothetical protein LCGC14_0771550 [marine sediment metagenome]|uniref:Uncharacterized protein n=1 Tax=marine sediment metagenome TaxID=412755 RepID=A0A0F9QHX6_9ZZZZ
MGYKEQFDQVTKDKSGRNLSPKYTEFKKDGDQVIGRMLAKNSVTGTIGGGSYNQYLFDTDKGLTKFALGSATDNEAGQLMKVGGVYSITFKGKEQLQGGRSINRFDIIEIEAAGNVVVGNPGDIPF